MFGTREDKSEILESPCKVSWSCDTTETAMGVSIKLVSLFVAVTITSSTSADSSESCANRKKGVKKNTIPDSK